MSKPVDLLISPTLADIDPQDWDTCADPGTTPGGRAADPFVTHRFLQALEASGSVGPGTGWLPRYLVAREAEQVIAVAPLYAKTHSQGEYVFDHSWAHAYEQAGGRYYPKLQIAVPFTPVTGRRLLTRPGYEELGQAALVQGAIEVADQNDLSSLHVTFCDPGEVAAGKAMGLMHRTGQQFHWDNAGYSDFAGFLADLSSRKRKNIRKERQTAQAFGGKIVQLTGDDIQPEHWDAFWEFYQDTGSRKWGTPYLTRAFFDHVHETMRDDILLVLAIRDGTPIAGALNFIGKDRLFGRYWGCLEHHPCLHFELCYYQAIDYAIAMGLSRVEAGAQGEHKLARGYLPNTTHSLHWVADPGFAHAVEEFLTAERVAVEEEVDILTSYGPFKTKHGDDDDHD